MKKLTILFLAAIAVSACAVSVLFHRQSQAKVRAGETMLQEESNQLASLALEHERLLNLRDHSNTAPLKNYTAELAKLRREMESLMEQTNELGKSLAKNSAVSKTASSAGNFDTLTQQEKMDEVRSARDLSLAFILYAKDHQNQAPASIDQMAPYITQLSRPVPKANQFEIGCQGSLEKFQGIPSGTVAVVQSRQSWRRADGTVVRFYGFLDGHGEAVRYGDDLKLVLPPLKGDSE